MRKMMKNTGKMKKMMAQVMGPQGGQRPTLNF